LFEKEACGYIYKYNEFPMFETVVHLGWKSTAEIQRQSSQPNIWRPSPPDEGKIRETCWYSAQRWSYGAHGEPKVKNTSGNIRNIIFSSNIYL